MKYQNEFIVHTAFCWRKWSPIKTETYWCLIRAGLPKKFTEIIFCTHNLQTHTICTFIIYKYSPQERTLNNECKSFSPLLCFCNKYIFFDIIMRLMENNVLGPKYINIFEFWGVWGGRTYSTIHFCLLFKKKEEVQESPADS